MLITPLKKCLIPHRANINLLTTHLRLCRVCQIGCVMWHGPPVLLCLSTLWRAAVRTAVFISGNKQRYVAPLSVALILSSIMRLSSLQSVLVGPYWTLSLKYTDRSIPSPLVLIWNPIHIQILYSTVFLITCCTAPHSTVLYWTELYCTVLYWIRCAGVRCVDTHSHENLRGPCVAGQLVHHRERARSIYWWVTRQDPSTYINPIQYTK